MNNSFFSSLIKQYNNKTTISVLVLSLLWVASDINDRYLFKIDNTQKQTKIATLTPLHLPVLSNFLYKRLTAKIAPYDKSKQDQNKATAASAQIMSAEQQAQQQGKLKTVFVGDNTLQLKAVIAKVKFDTKNTTEQKQLSALIAIKNSKTKKTVIKKYRNNSLIFGYTLTIKRNTQVVLTKVNQEHKQKIILAMYAIKKPSKLNHNT